MEDDIEPLLIMKMTKIWNIAGNKNNKNSGKHPLTVRIINMINAFPSTNGISDTMILSTIVEETPKLDFIKDMLAFGSYIGIYRY